MTENIGTDPLQRLVDKDEIVDLVHRYSFLADGARFDDLVELFVEDCEFDAGSVYGVMRGRAALRQQYVDALGAQSPIVRTSHHNANVLVTFGDADRASVVTSVYAWHQFRDGPSAAVWGHYQDVVVRTGDGWRFLSRRLEVAGADAAMGTSWNPISRAGTE